MLGLLFAFVDFGILRWICSVTLAGTADCFLRLLGYAVLFGRPLLLAIDLIDDTHPETHQPGVDPLTRSADVPPSCPPRLAVPLLPLLPRGLSPLRDTVSRNNDTSRCARNSNDDDDVLDPANRTAVPTSHSPPQAPVKCRKMANLILFMIFSLILLPLEWYGLSVVVSTHDILYSLIRTAVLLVLSSPNLGVSLRLYSILLAPTLLRHYDTIAKECADFGDATKDSKSLAAYVRQTTPRFQRQWSWNSTELQRATTTTTRRLSSDDTRQRRQQEIEVNVQEQEEEDEEPRLSYPPPRPQPPAPSRAVEEIVVEEPEVIAVLEEETFSRRSPRGGPFLRSASAQRQPQKTWSWWHGSKPQESKEEVDIVSVEVEKKQPSPRAKDDPVASTERSSSWSSYTRVAAAGVAAATAAAAVAGAAARKYTGRNSLEAASDGHSIPPQPSQVPPVPTPPPRLPRGAARVPTPSEWSSSAHPHPPSVVGPSTPASPSHTPASSSPHRWHDTHRAHVSPHSNAGRRSSSPLSSDRTQQAKQHSATTLIPVPPPVKPPVRKHQFSSALRHRFWGRPTAPDDVTPPSPTCDTTCHGNRTEFEATGRDIEEEGAVILGMIPVTPKEEI